MYSPISFRVNSTPLGIFWALKEACCWHLRRNAVKAFFVSIPHSGEMIPKEAGWLLNLPEVLKMYDVDRFVDILYTPAIEKLKLKSVIADIHRYVIDLNRLSEDVDASSVIGHTNPAGKFSRGLHWVITTAGEKLMPAPISKKLHDELVVKYFNPFHSEIQSAYQSFQKLGAKKIYHLDLHSMPSVGTSEHKDPGERRADIVVSDCIGKSCSAFLKDLVVNSYQDAGFKVAYNWPYVGGRITEAYGSPSTGNEAIQVELNRALYMDESSKKLFQEKLTGVQSRLEKALSLVQQSLPEIGS